MLFFTIKTTFHKTTVLCILIFEQKKILPEKAYKKKLVYTQTCMVHTLMDSYDILPPPRCSQAAVLR